MTTNKKPVLRYVDGNFGEDKAQKIGLVECWHKLALAAQGGIEPTDLEKNCKVEHVKMQRLSELSEEERKAMAWEDGLNTLSL